MSLSDILSSALSGLGATQAELRTVSNNISNVNTPGYARQRVSLQPIVTSGRVDGVMVGEPERVVDKFLEAAVYGRAGDAGRAEAASGYLDRLQGMLGANGAESSLPARLDAIASSATAMTGTAGATQTNAAFVGNVADAITSMQQLTRDVAGLKADVDGEVSTGVDRINSLLANIHDLNESVARLQGLGRSTAGPADQRVSAMQELSGLIGINTREQPDGRIFVDTATGVQLIDRRSRQLSYPSTEVGSAQSSYPPIEVRLVDAKGVASAATGEKLDSPSVGGKLGGLLDIRDRQLPAFGERMGTVFGGLAQTLNAASNAGTAVPPPATLEGRATALTGGDRMGFTGAATFAVTKSDGTILAATTIDFTALAASANPSVDDAVAAINAGLGGAGIASFADGTFTIAATGAGNGVVVMQDAAKPSARGGVGFSQYFGLNDVVRSDASTLAPSGFVASDAHGFAAGQQAEIALRDSSGKLVAKVTLDGSGGPTFGDLVGTLNNGPLGGYGAFSLDASGRMRFDATTANAGASLYVLSDQTDRAGTGRSFSSIVGLTGDASGLGNAEVRRDLVADPGKLPLARLQSVTVGQKALGIGDRSGATGFVDVLSRTIDLGKDGITTIGRLTATVLGDAGTAASRAQDRVNETTARRDDAIDRRDSISGVNIEEELAQMVVLQNSYSANARVVTTAQSMYDTLLGMLR